MKHRTIASLVLIFCGIAAAAQTDNSKPSDKQDQKDSDYQMIGDTQEADVPPKSTPPPAVGTSPEQWTDYAWSMLSDGVTDSKPEVRISALSALGTMGGYPKAYQMVIKASSDPDHNVRVAAVAALGTIKDRNSIPQLRQLLDDPEPDVAFSAAVALWKMDDYTGENLLYEVLTGQRRSAQGAIAQGKETAHRDLHSPATLARIGATQGAFALLGPFGIGLSAARMVAKGDNGQSARVLCANLLAEDHSEITREQFLVAITDKDYLVRGASARALGAYRGQDVNTALIKVLDDSKPTVRYMAAASLIRANGPVEKQKRTTKLTRSVEPEVQ